MKVPFISIISTKSVIFPVEFSDDDDDDDDDETDIERKSDKGKIFFKDLLSKRSKRTSS